jgi:hypothetical protein
MQINWCLKGIRQQSRFGDTEAQAVLDHHGLPSAWLLDNDTKLDAGQANRAAQAALSFAALDAHVNHFGLVAADTPYISLSAGCWEFAGKGKPAIHYPAMGTALDFATDSGKSAGYVFRMWVITGLQSLAALPGVAEEVRDLNLFSAFTQWHEEGEIAAKIVVPRRQIICAIKVGSNKSPIPWAGASNGVYVNLDYVPPESASNLLGLL